MRVLPSFRGAASKYSGDREPADIGLRAAIAVLLALTLIGASLRLYDLGETSLSHDELLTHYTAGHESLRDVIWRDVDWSFHPPGYFVLMGMVMRWFGDSEWVLRLPSAIAGIVSIPAIYVVGGRMHSRRCGLIAAALCASSTFLIYWSREARPYAILCLLSILLVVAALDLLRAETSKYRPLLRFALPYTLIAIALANLHYFGVLWAGLIGACLFVLAVPRRRLLLTVLALNLFVLAAYVPWLRAMWWQLTNVSPGIPAPVGSAPREFLKTQNAFFNYLETVLSPTPMMALLALLFAVAATWGGYLAYRDRGSWSRERIQIAVLLAAWVVAPFAFAYLRSTDSSSVYTFRNLIVSAPASFLAIAMFVASIRVPPNWVAFASMLIAATLAGNLLFRIEYYERPLKDEIREATAWVVSHQRETKPSVVFIKGYRSRIYYYYFEQLNGGAVPYAAGLNDGDLERVRDIVRREDAAYVWYMYRPPRPPSAFMDFLFAEYEPAGAWSFTRMEVLLFQVRTER